MEFFNMWKIFYIIWQKYYFKLSFYARPDLCNNLLTLYHLMHSIYSWIRVPNNRSNGLILSLIPYLHWWPQQGMPHNQGALPSRERERLIPCHSYISTLLYQQLRFDIPMPTNFGRMKGVEEDASMPPHPYIPHNKDVAHSTYVGSANKQI